MSYERHVMFPRLASLALAASLPLLTVANPATRATAAPLVPARAPAGVTAVPAAVAPAPRNVIVMIGDGMGFDQLDAGTLYRDGTSSGQVDVSATGGLLSRVAGVLPSELASSDVQLAMRTTQYGGTYDPSAAWSNFGNVLVNPTDSAAAATAMATGTKTLNGAIGVDVNGATLENLTEYAIATGRKAGVVTSVPFSHATPAGFSAHDTSRDHYKAIARDQLRSKLSVIMGAGHPKYTDDNLRRSATYTYLYKSDYRRLVRGTSGFTYLSSKKRFTALTKGSTPKRVFGLARVATTLQEKRSGSTSEPGTKRNAVPSLATMARGALNVLDRDPDGLFLMVEGGAIDWANHANEKGRLVEEVDDFLHAVSAVNTWVETHSSWDETLLVVTADHESGYLTGVGSNPDWTAITGTAGSVPSMTFHSNGHTRQLVPLFAHGAGASVFTGEVLGDDPVRGAYLDNTSIAAVVERLWS